VGADLDPGSPNGIARLQRMPTPDRSRTPHAATDVDVKASDNRCDDRTLSRSDAVNAAQRPDDVRPASLRPPSVAARRP
jgi:hypothetical protein